MRRAQKTSSQAGYSFIEVLTAFAILSFAIAALLPTFSSSLRTTKTVETRTLARLQLESLLSETGVSRPLSAGEHAGVFDDDMTWEIAITPQRTTQGMALFHITASVSWMERGAPNTLRIETLRIGPASISETTDAQDNR